MTSWPQWKQEQDPQLWDSYAYGFTEPGWAGEITQAQYEHIRNALMRDRKLRTSWGFIHSNGKLSFDTVQAVAMWGDPEDRRHNIRLIQRAREFGLEAPVSAFEDGSPYQEEKVTAVRGAIV